MCPLCCPAEFVILSASPADVLSNPWLFVALTPPLAAKGIPLEIAVVFDFQVTVDAALATIT